MNTKKFKDTEFAPSLLGLGCMRLPKLDPAQEAIDEVRAQEMVDYAHAHGVTYFDTAYPYHGGTSEKFIGKALSKYERESFFLASKMPIWKIETLADAEQVFSEQLQNCRVEYFDFYLMHAMTQDRFEKAEKMGLYEFLQQKKAEGKIRHLGFSFHDAPEVLERMCTARTWDFAQLQLNYLDWEMQRANEQYAILERHGIPCMVMEPVRGGALASLCPQADAVLQAAAPGKSIASWALRWAAGKPNVQVVLSGMSNMEQLQDNIATMSPFCPMTAKENAALDEALRIYRENHLVPCTGCRYCMDCPFGVDIPKIFSIYNSYRIGKNHKNFVEQMEELPPSARPSQCRACGKCRTQCPQHIDIPAQMTQIAAQL